MPAMEFCLGATWLVTEVPGSDALDRVFREFDVDGGDPCVWLEPAGTGSVVVTWDASVTCEDGDPYQVALAEARRVAQQRIAASLRSGRLVEVSAAMDDGSLSIQVDEDR